MSTAAPERIGVALQGWVRIPGRPMPAWKRAIDIVLGGTALLLLLPLIGLLALAVVLDSPGPAFFGQIRVGAGGRMFTCWKFRSMRTGSEAELARLLANNEAKNGPIFKMRRDPRLTRVGKLLRRTSLDELPQLWNVVRGEMSLVGPRPPLPSEVVRYAEHHLRRLQGVPGITGLWQVTARERHDFEEMVALDVRYFEELSLLADIKIMLRTVLVVVSGRGSY